MQCHPRGSPVVVTESLLAQAGAPRSQSRLEDDLDRLGGDLRGKRAEDADLSDLVLLRSVVPPREMADLAHVDVRGGALRRLVADRPEKVEARRHDAGRVPELALGDLEDGLPGLPRACPEVPTGGVRFSDPNGQLAIERNDHRELGRRGRVLAEGVVTPRNE